MSSPSASGVASPRVIAQTLALFYLAGCVLGSVVALTSDGDVLGRWTVGVISAAALPAAGVLARWGPRWPRAAFHLPTSAATVLISVCAVTGPDTPTAVVLAAMTTWIAVEAYFFYGGWVAHVHVGAALVLVTAALGLRGDIPLATILALVALTVTLGAVVLRLVARAADAARDPLTGLLNRRGFDERLVELTDRSGPLSAALIDLDHFKQVNDTLGHDAGDQLLCRVARSWERTVPGDAVLARHGGDEFALLLPGLTGTEALSVVRRLSRADPRVGLSIGVAEAVPGESAAQLMRQADIALYAAKAAGRGRCALHGDPGVEDPTAPADAAPASAVVPDLGGGYLDGSVPARG